MRRASRLQASKNWLIFQSLAAASFVGRRMTLARARRIGARVGGLAYRTLPRERVRALRSLAIAFPDLTETDRLALLRDSFRHLGMSLLEICWLPNLSREALGETMVIEGIENLQEAVDRGKGVVLFTGHCGNWEWMASAIGLSGFNMNVIAREIYDLRINQFVVESRQRHGVKSIGRGSGSSAREILQTLKSGAILGVMLDQSIEVENVPIPFFGREAPTPIGPAKLAIRSGATAIAGFIERQGTVQRLHFQKPIPTTRGDDPVDLTRRMTKAIEEQIRRVPAQWVWMHQRWRER